MRSHDHVRGYEAVWRDEGVWRHARADRFSRQFEGNIEMFEGRVILRPPVQ